MSLRGALGVVGAVVGFIYGGPAGAQWGWAIGSAIGSIVDPQVIKGPSIGDVATQTSSEGGPRPIILGRSPPISGNVIAQGEPVIVTTKKSGKGGPKIEIETAYRTYAIGFGEGPITSFLRVWRNGKKVYDALDDSFDEEALVPVPGSGRFGVVYDVSPSKNAQFLQNARFFLGEYTQDPSPDLEALFGVGTTAAHRGTVYMVMADEDVTDMQGAIPQWTAELSNGDVSQVLSNEVLWPWLLSQKNPSHPLNTNVYRVVNYRNGSVDASIASTDFDTLEDALNAITPFNPIYSNYLALAIGYSPYQGVGVGSNAENAWVAQTENATNLPLLLEYRHRHATIAFASGFGAGRDPEHIGHDDTGSDTPWSLFPVDFFAGDPTYMSNYFTAPQGAANNWGRMWKWYLSGDNEAPYGFGTGTGTPGGYAYSYYTAHVRVTSAPGAPSETAVPITGTFKVLKTFNSTTGTPYPKPLNPCLEPGDPNYSNQAYWDAAAAQAKADGDMDPSWVYGTNYPVVVTDAYYYYTSANEAGGLLLTTMVTAICERANISEDRIDVSLLPEVVVPGLVIVNTYPAEQALAALGEIYAFDFAYWDSKVRFVPRGGDAVAVITEDDMVDDDEEIEDAEVVRGDTLGIPRLLSLVYFDADSAGLDPSKQTSEREGDYRAIGEMTMQTAVVIDADTAARANSVAHKMLVERVKGELKFSLPDRWNFLTPTDPIIVQYQGKSLRAVIAAVDECDGYQKYRCLRDRQSANTSDVEGIPPPPLSDVPTNQVGPTLVVPLDISILQDADDNVGLGYSIAIAGLSPAWSGALVELSYDGGANYLTSQRVTTQAVIGELTEVLNDHPQAYPDVTNGVTVRLLTNEAELEAVSFEALLNRYNLAAVGDPDTGWELINFATPLELGSGDWYLTTLLRGRKGTTPRQHEVDEMFVLLDRSVVLFIPASIADVGKTLTLRATSVGTTVDTGTVISMVYAGASQTERAPCSLTARRDGSDVVASWKGVGRLGGGAVSVQGSRFTGYRVTFDDGVDQIVVDQTEEQITQDVSSLSGAITVSVSQLNSLTGAGPSIGVTLQ